MYYIGIDIGGTNLKGGIVDFEGNIIAKKSYPTHTSETLVAELVELTNDLLKTAGLTVKDITSVGMGIPGFVDVEAGVVKYSNNLKMLNLSVVKEYREKIDVPTFIANDADVAALGESLFGSGKGIKNIIFITLGTGVGTGITVSGKLLAGTEGGHIQIKLDGKPCTCGNTGCFECYASANALKAMTEETAEQHPDSILAKLVREQGVSGKTAFDGDRLGDPVSHELVDRYLSYVATGIVSLANIFSPECVLIGGGVSNEEPKYFDIVAKKVNEGIYAHEHKEWLPVKPASLKNDAGILGAASLAISCSTEA